VMLERPRASAPVEAPARWRAENIGIRRGRVVIKCNEAHGAAP
jgi:hypothetical protein